MRAATTNRGRAMGVVLASLVALCSCGGALGFVAPSVAVGRVSAAASAGERTAAAAAAAVPTSTTGRSRALPRLHAAKGPPGPAGGPDFMDSIAGAGEREMTTEEKVAALQREVRAQVALADGQAAEDDEEEEGEEEEKKEVVEIPSVEAEQDAPPEEEESGGSGKEDFVAAADFVDEGKNILWPNPRRAAQLTLLAVVAQIAFIVYIISLNSFLKAFPLWFEKFVEVIKSGDVQLPGL